MKRAGLAILFCAECVGFSPRWPRIVASNPPVQHKKPLANPNPPTSETASKNEPPLRPVAVGWLDSRQYFHNYENMDKQRALTAMAALAQEARLDIFRTLVQAGPEGLAAGQLAESLGLPSATLSFHLKELRHAGLVSFQRESRSLIYSAEFASMNALLAYLTENCCQGDAAACGAGLCDGTNFVKPEPRKPT